jgi:hypothetical protein
VLYSSRLFWTVSFSCSVSEIIHLPIMLFDFL